MAGKYSIYPVSQLLTVLLIVSTSANETPPILRVLRSVDSVSELKNNYDNQNEKFKPLNITQNSDLLIETSTADAANRPRTKLIFECRASSLVQWVYTGLGFPEFSTNLTMTSNKEFVASIYLGFQQNLGEQDTGNYTCKSIRDPNISSYIYLFSPSGTALFTTKGHENITFTKTDETVTIPCSLSQPKATVTLHKFTNGQIHCSMNESMIFNKKTGYLLRVRELPDPQGTYVCSASYNHQFQMIEYNLVSLENNENGSTNTAVTENKKCKMNSNCASDKACVEGTCLDPCKIVCANNTDCLIVSHTPQCSCSSGYVGDPYGSECVPDKQESSASERSTTEPLFHETSTIMPKSTAEPNKTGPCDPNPCGENSSCKFDGWRILCTCQSGYLGTPPNCRPECERDSDCLLSKACTVKNRCENPCKAGVCGTGALCRTVNHYPICSCPIGSVGDAYINCQPSDEFNPDRPTHIIKSPCDSSVSPCGPNTQCEIINNQAACRCVPDYRGNPYKGCQLDGCSSNRHCSNRLACFVENGACVDPCVLRNPCMERQCVVNKHIPICLPNPKSPSTSENEGNSTANLDACMSSPCGPNTICKNYKGAASCSCMPRFEGNPWVGCAKTECRNDGACNLGEKCIDATCVKNPERFTNEIVSQKNVSKNEMDLMEESICNRSLCGNKTRCRVINKDKAICECILPFRGDQYQECEIPCNSNSDCPNELSCSKDNYCTNICNTKNPCGKGALCSIVNHKLTCTCPDKNYIGNPVIECVLLASSIKSNQTLSVPNDNDIPPIACHPLPCGKNAFCHVETDFRSCKCLPNFYGDPYNSCQRGVECEKNDNCSSESVCINRRCVDPCKWIGICGVNQVCKTAKHTPTCHCKAGYKIRGTGYCQKV